ncbi:MAG TPA: hypothetical protein VHI98_04370 [Vicinamibacterales bacterium]|nr:hypothetical protein [Vicinamibacterales bacterium]
MRRNRREIRALERDVLPPVMRRPEPGDLRPLADGDLRPGEPAGFKPWPSDGSGEAPA